MVVKLLLLGLLGCCLSQAQASAVGGWGYVVLLEGEDQPTPRCVARLQEHPELLPAGFTQKVVSADPDVMPDLPLCNQAQIEQLIFAVQNITFKNEVAGAPLVAGLCIGGFLGGLLISPQMRTAVLGVWERTKTFVRRGITTTAIWSHKGLVAIGLATAACVTVGIAVRYYYIERETATRGPATP